MLSEEHYSQLATYHEQDMTAVQAWHDLLDNQDAWIPISSVQNRFRQFDLEQSKVQPAPEK